MYRAPVHPHFLPWCARGIGRDAYSSVYCPFKALLPMVEPNDVVFDGWDISGMNMADAMERAQVTLNPKPQTPKP
jgi:hypothetical protein